MATTTWANMRKSRLQSSSGTNPNEASDAGWIVNWKTKIPVNCQQCQQSMCLHWFRDYALLPQMDWGLNRIYRAASGHTVAGPASQPARSAQTVSHAVILPLLQYWPLEKTMRITVLNDILHLRSLPIGLSQTDTGEEVAGGSRAGWRRCKTVSFQNGSWNRSSSSVHATYIGSAHFMFWRFWFRGSRLGQDVPLAWDDDAQSAAIFVSILSHLKRSSDLHKKPRIGTEIFVIITFVSFQRARFFYSPTCRSHTLSRLGDR